MEDERVVALPGRASRNVVVATSFAQTTVLLADRGETTSLAAFVDGVADPVDPRVATNLIQLSFQVCKEEERGLTALWLGSTRMTS